MLALGHPRVGHLVAVLLCASAVPALGKRQTGKESKEKGALLGESMEEAPGDGGWGCWGKVCLEGDYTRWSHEERGPRW